MNIDIRWAKVPAACGGGTFASMLRRERRSKKQTHKAELGKWENEGGNLASPDATDAPVTIGSA